MKRWIIFLGRGGTVLIAIGLALLLASFIPSVQLGGFVGTTFVAPKKFHPLAYFEAVPTLTPQQEIQVTITANGTLKVYLLEVSTQAVYDWISEHHPEQEMTFDFFNLTRLEEFLEANPDSISWQEEIRNGKIGYGYVSTKVTNVTIILSNPTSDYIIVDYEGTKTSIVAPGTKVRNLAQWTIPIGFVLTLPWLARLWKEKTH